MKKTYINPNMSVVMLQMQQHVLTMSGEKGTLSTKSASEWGAREFNFDPDEE